MTVIANLDNLVRSANFECNGEREITSADGSKCLKCFPYSRAQENNTVCMIEENTNVSVSSE